MAGSAPRRSRLASATSSSRTATQRRDRRACSISKSSPGHRGLPHPQMPRNGVARRLARSAPSVPTRSSSGNAHGRRDARAHGEHRDGLWHGAPRPEERRTDRRRSPAEDARLRRTHSSATSWTSARSDRTRARAASTCSSAGVHGRVPEGYFVVKSPTYTVIRCSRLQGGREDRPGRGAHEADQGVPAGQGGRPADDGVPQRLRQGHRHDPRHHRVLRDAGPARQRRTAGGLHAAGTLPHAGHRHREGQAVQPRREGQALLSEAARAGGAMARANSFASAGPTRTTTRTASGSTSASCRTIS